MRSLRLFLAFTRWDVLRELRRKDTLSNMVLFAVLVLFLAQLGIGARQQQIEAVGPVVFWIAVLFSGTIALSRSFAAEREGNALGAILTAPVDPGLFYLSKVASTFLNVLCMEAITLVVYTLLFNVPLWNRFGEILLVASVFTLSYLALGVVLAAMTSTLRGGGEVILRILLFPLMIPVIWLTLRVSASVFNARVGEGVFAPLDLGTYVVLGLAFDTLYLASGFLLFPKVIEE